MSVDVGLFSAATKSHAKPFGALKARESYKIESDGLTSDHYFRTSLVQISFIFVKCPSF